MSKGRKMCKYKSVTGRLFGININCSNPDITQEQTERVKQNAKYCCARLCPCYVSK